MSKENQKESPKVSPFSMSVWQDTENPNKWNWSVQAGTKVEQKGHALDPIIAANHASSAMRKVIK